MKFFSVNSSSSRNTTTCTTNTTCSTKWAKIILIGLQCHLIILIIIINETSCSILIDGVDRFQKRISFFKTTSTSASNNNNNNNNVVSVDNNQNRPQTKLFPNSPIIYFKLKPTLLSASSSSSTTSLHRQYQTKSKDFTSLRRLNSNIYKLPLKFVSNAKPVSIIHGIGNYHKPHYGTKSNLPSKNKLAHNLVKYQNSKVFYLPTKFISNAKPIKPYIINTSNNINNNNNLDYNNGHHQNFYLF